ncbi:uncharacterized protein [Diabrotica undecimpunctata]|uniref:uncharacterized protein n=1 Tax=Diabrotica undecimpunctata TaxID=50387 RepID=UPI003B63A8F6
MEEKGFEDQFVCRACLKIVERTTQSFGYVDDATGNLRDLLMCCVPELDIYVSSNPIICFGCIQGLIQVHNFKSKCINTENIIRTYMHKYKVPEEQLINLGSVVKDVVEVNKFHKQQEDLRRQFLMEKRIIGNPLNSSCPPPLIYHDGPSQSIIPAPVQEFEKIPTTYEQTRPVLPLIIDTDQLRSLTTGCEQTQSPSAHYQPSASGQILPVNFGKTLPIDHEQTQPITTGHLQPMDNIHVKSFNPQLTQSIVPQQLQATGYGQAYTPAISLVQPQNVPLMSPQNIMSMSSSHGPPLHPRFVSSMDPRYISSTGGPQVSSMSFISLPPSTSVPTSLSVGTMRSALANKLNPNRLVNGIGVSSDIPPLVAIPSQQKRPAVESGSNNLVQRQESITNTYYKSEPEYHPIEKKRRLVIRLPRMKFVIPSNPDAVSFNQTESSSSYGASTEEQQDVHEVVPEDQEIANFETDIIQEDEDSVIKSENGNVMPEHNITKIYNCACMYLTTSQSLFNEHKTKCQMSKIGSKQMFKCPHCTHVTNRPYAINKHINTMHTKSVWFMCETCNYKSTDKSCLRRHVRKNHENPDPIKQYPCHICDMVITNKYNFRRHLLKHDEAISYDCEFCSYNCKDKSNFRKHLFTHSPKLLPCSFCAYNHVSPYQLRNHLKKHHEGVGMDKVDVKSDMAIVELVEEIRTLINSVDNYLIPIAEEIEAPEVIEDS